MLPFIIGMFIGSSVGFFIAALMAASKDFDDRLERALDEWTE